MVKKKAHLSTQKKCTHMDWKNFPSCITNSTQALPQIGALFLSPSKQSLSITLNLPPPQPHLIMEDAHALHVTPMRRCICNSPVSSTVTFHDIKSGSSRGMGEILWHWGKKNQAENVVQKAPYFHIATLNLDSAPTCCRTGTVPVIKLVWYSSETPCRNWAAAKKKKLRAIFFSSPKLQKKQVWI